MLPKKKQFRLLRYFVIVSLICIVLAIVVLGSLFRQSSINNLTAIGENQNLALARVLSNYVWPKYQFYLQGVGAAQVQDSAQLQLQQSLHDDVMRHIDSTSIIKLKIYSVDGLTLYSTNKKDIGVSKGGSKNIAVASKGQVVTELVFRDHFDQGETVLTARNVLTTYMPVTAAADSSDKPGAVIEIYSDVTTLIEKVTTARNYASTGVGIVLLILYAVLFVFVRKADRTIGMQFEEKQQDEEKIRHIAFHDGLTGLPNRDLFSYRLQSAIAQAKRNDKLLAILFLDVDRFKQINDNLGHDAGDEMLCEVAKRLCDCVRLSDTVSRRGGDEFTVLLENVNHVDEIVLVCDRMINAVGKEFNVRGNTIHSSISIGITVFPFDDIEIDNLLKDADVAMYEAKASGRNKYMFFAEGMQKSNVEKLKMDSQLRTALAEDEYILNFQPIVDLRKGEMTGVEALLRWKNADYGIVSPGEFIPLLEESGYMVIVGEWVLMEACRKARQWQDEGFAPITMAVNVSMVQFQQINFVDTVKQALQQSGLDTKWLKLEITESMLMEHNDICMQKLNALRDMGIAIEIDDFGTGYSSLGYLKKLPIDILKVDRSFVTDIQSGQDGAGIVTAIMAMAHSLKLEVIAEGVECKEELKFLAALNCRFIQGYFFSKPVSDEELKELMAQPDYFLNKIQSGNEHDEAASY